MLDPADTWFPSIKLLRGEERLWGGEDQLRGGCRVETDWRLVHQDGSRRGLAGPGFEVFGDKGEQGLSVCSLRLRAVKAVL